MPLISRKREFTPIGLDIENGAICAVQFRRTRKGLRVHATAKSVATTGEANRNPVAELQSAMHGTNFVGRDVVSAISNTETDVRPVQLPAEIDSDRHPGFWEAIRMEASSCLLYTPDEAVIDYLPLNDNPELAADGLQVLLIAARKECVNRHLALLRAARLRSVHLDVGGCAAARLVGRDDEAVAIVDYGPECTSVTMARGKQLLFSRAIRTGHSALTAAVTKGLGIEEHEAIHMLRTIGIRAESRSASFMQSVEENGRMSAEDIASTIFETCYDVLDAFSGEIRRSLEYFSAQRPDFAPEKVILAGPLLPLNIEHCLSSRLPLPIEMADSLSTFTDDADSVHRDPAYVVAAGLAMRGEAA
jgi:type IV pilus assembly protein PilM